MRVTVISPFLPPVRWPEADLALRLAERLTAGGHRITVITAKSKDRYRGAAALDVQPRIRDWTWSSLPQLVVRVLRSRPDAVLIVYVGPSYGRHPMITLLPRLLRRFRPATRVVCYVTYPMGCDPTMSSALVARLARKICGATRSDELFGTLLSDSTHVLCMSRWQRDTLVERCPRLESRITISPTASLVSIRSDVAMARTEGRARLQLHDTDELVAFFGYFYASKGLHYLLDAVAALVRAGRPIHLVLIGGKTAAEPDITDELLRHVATDGLEDRVHWSGAFDGDSDLPSVLLHAADIAVMPFEQGAQLNHSSLSAVLAHGLPVVTTFRAATTDAVFVDKTNVLMCPLSDASALAVAMALVLDDPKLRDQLRLGARTLATDWFSVERLDERLARALSA